MVASMNAHIVVGIDNTPASAAALRWAVHEAERVGGDVLALYVQHRPGLGAPASTGSAVRWAFRAFDRPAAVSRLTVATRVGDPGPVLVDAASRATLLVLGVNRRELATSAVTDVVAHCQRSARCRVVLVAEDGQLVDRLMAKPTEVFIG